MGQDAGARGRPGGVPTRRQSAREAPRSVSSSRVRRVPMTPGTLLLFEGRNSMHRVTPIAGPTARLVALLAYDTKPDTVSTELLRWARYGRS